MAFCRPSAAGEGRVLSIQSHTVQGYVGNKAATFPLQLLGFDVDTINSVQFSNHTGFPTWRGHVLDGDQLWELIEGLDANKLLNYTHLLTGYIGSLSFLDRVLAVVDKLKKVNPDLIFVCDPVLGDEGQLYVNPDLVPVYRDKVVPLAQVLTPNQFEVEQLVGFRIHNLEDAVRACDVLHAAGPGKVVITSLDLNMELIVLGSDVTRAVENKKPTRFKISIAKLPQQFTGTGDLMSALILGWSHKYPDNLRKATELSVASLQSVLRRTVEDCQDWLPPGGDGKKGAGGKKEEEEEEENAAGGAGVVRRQLFLRLIQSRDDLIKPEITLLAVPLSI